MKTRTPSLVATKQGRRDCVQAYIAVSKIQEIELNYNILHLARLRKRLTLENVAVIIGVKPSTVHRWESGVSPDGTSLIRICKLYGLSIEDLIGGDVQQDEIVSFVMG